MIAVQVVKTVINPRFVTGYVDDNSNNDIALLLLDKPSTKTPIALPPFTRECCSGSWRDAWLCPRGGHGSAAGAAGAAAAAEPAIIHSPV